MRKIILLIAFATCSVAMFGQFAFGIKAGYNTSLGFDKDWNFDASNVNIKSDLGQGFHAGVFARIGKRWYAQPELYYNMQKTNYQIRLSDIQNIDQSVTLSTLDLPIMVGFKIIDMSNINLRIMLGPQFRFNAGSVAAEVEIVVSDPKKAQIGFIDLTFDFVSEMHYTCSIIETK